MKNKVVVIVGPTASGKTSLSIEIASHFNGEVISADSMQIYKNMDIATAKPDKNEMRGITHHLIDFLPQTEKFSVARYKEFCYDCIDEIIKKEKLPVIVGGTGLYVDTVINNTVFLEYESNDIRQKLEEECEKSGIESLYNRLCEIDKESAEKLNLSDKKRIIRALEVYYSTGKTKTQQNDLSHVEESKYDFCIIGLNAVDRNVLYERINKRVDLMLSMGLIEEARAFFENDYSSTAVQAIGYKELKPFLDGICSLEDAVEKLKMETRRYAKRQLTWFRRNEKINWLYLDSDMNIVREAIDIIEKFGVKADGKQEN